MLDVESQAKNKLPECPSEISSISRSSDEDRSSKLWRQSSTGGAFGRRRNVASCLVPSPPRVSVEQKQQQQQREPLLNVDLDERRRHRDEHRRNHKQDIEATGCVPLRISWLSSMLSLATIPRPTRSGPSETQSRHQDQQHRVFIWRAITRRVLQQRLRRRDRGSSSNLSRRGRSLPVDMSYDESSYAKNFDLGQESWFEVDEGFRRAALWEAQSGRSRSAYKSQAVSSSQ